MRVRERNGMWLLTMFDLPSTSASMRRNYSRFRKCLLQRGFEMRQKSVYLRWEDTVSAADSTSRWVLANAPSEGHVSVMKLTSRTMNNVSILTDREKEPPPKIPDEFLVC